ncbi:MAG: Na+/H+ antiporter NhaA [Gammaproteobacteria bacterium]|nr:MAG: Na+/H+ antiporter NhaA [Gammaproteobacteria bacterium]
MRLLREFLRHEAASGFLLLGAALLALLAANSPLRPYYQGLLDLHLGIRLGELSLDKPLHLWINDGLMALFFFLVGLEIKREWLVGQLRDRRRAVLPAAAAAGGMAVPALVYVAVNWGDPEGLRGWAIPTATDIAFALGVLALLGPRVPAGLKLFLLALAILDDLGAIVVIALFYTAELSWASLAGAGLVVLLLWLLHRRGVTALPPYLLLGLALWVTVLQSGVHATLAGVVAALFIPLRPPPGDRETVLERLEHELHPTVAYVILPLFAFANAGLPLEGLSLADLLDPVPLGVLLGLFLGKQAGVFLGAWLAVRLGWAQPLPGVGWLQLYGAALLCGIGFTMSLFIGSLAFEEAGAPSPAVDERLGILLGSLLSAVAGYGVLRRSLRGPAQGPGGGTGGGA